MKGFAIRWSTFSMAINCTLRKSLLAKVGGATYGFRGKHEVWNRAAIELSHMHA